MSGIVRDDPSPERQERAVAAEVEGSGTSDDPWVLTTPPGGSEFEAWRDEASDPPALVVQVGTTQLRYHLRCIDDLHAMLRQAGDWVPLGNADEQKPAKDGTVEAWGARAGQPGRRLVRPEEGPAGPLRQLCPARARGAGSRRGRARPPATTACARTLTRRDAAGAQDCIPKASDATSRRIWHRFASDGGGVGCGARTAGSCRSPSSAARPRRS